MLGNRNKKLNTLLSVNYCLLQELDRFRKSKSFAGTGTDKNAPLAEEEAGLSDQNGRVFLFILLIIVVTNQFRLCTNFLRQLR